MKSKESQSWFASVPGMLALAALCILTAYFRLHLLTIFLVVVLLVMVIAFVWSRLSLRKVSVSTKALSCNVFSGEDIHFKLQITNDKVIPLPWVDVTYFDDVPRFIPDDAPLSHHLAWIMPRQSLVWEAVMRTTKRGIAFLDKVEATSGDGFGLGSETQDFPVSPAPMLVVYPKVVQVNAKVLADEITSMLPSDRGKIRDDSLFKGVRDYQSGDSTKNINWRVLARQGQLAVNLYQSLEPRLVTFILDLQSFTTWREEVTNSGVNLVLDSILEDDLEDMISLTASCMLSLAESGVRSILVLPSFADNELQIVSDMSMQEQSVKILTALAALDYKGEMTSFSRLYEHLHTFGQMWVVCEKGVLSQALSLEIQDQDGLGLLSARKPEEVPRARVMTQDRLRRDHAEA